MWELHLNRVKTLTFAASNQSSQLHSSTTSQPQHRFWRKVVHLIRNFKLYNSRIYYFIISSLSEKLLHCESVFQFWCSWFSSIFTYFCTSELVRISVCDAYNPVSEHQHQLYQQNQQNTSISCISHIFISVNSTQV